MTKRSLLSSSIAAAIILAGQPAFAQEQQEALGQLEEIVVTGIKGSLSRGLDIKRDSMQVVDAIVAEDIGKFPDNNVVEALQRVTGVQVTDRGAGEVSTVSIRGLTDVTTTVNGRTLFTAAGRGVALADIPASLLSSATVYKTRSAEHIESGIAGQLNIQTHRPFDFDDRKVVLAGRAIYQEQADSIDPNVSALVSDRWSTDFGEFGALFNVSYAETNYRDQGITSGAQFPFFTHNPPDGFAPYQQIPTEIGGETVWTPGLEAGLPFEAGSTLPVNGEQVEYVLARDALFHNDFTGTRERPAANVSLQFAPNETSEYLFEAFYNGYRNDSFNSLMFNFVNNHEDIGNFPSRDVTFIEGTNIIKERPVGSPGQFGSGDLSTGKTDSFVYALGGNWDIGSDLVLESEIVYQVSEFEGDFFAMRTNRTGHEILIDFNSGNGIPSYSLPDDPTTAADESDLTDATQWSMGELYDNANRDEGEALTFTFDGDWQANAGIFRDVSFGLRYDDRGAEAYQRTDSSGTCSSGTEACELATYPGLLHVNEDFYDGRADVPTSWLAADGYYIRENANMFRELYNTEAGANLPTGADLALDKNFEVDEATTAVYLQSTFETEVAGQILDGEFGVRYVNVETEMSAWNVDQPTEAPIFGETSTSELLPSAMVRYSITDDVILRLSYGETLRRPEFGQLNPNITYVADVTNIGYGTASGGNPDLDAVRSKNYDLALEWYFADSSSVYATLFRRNIEGLITDYRNRVMYQGPEDEEPYPYILSQPDNASNGELEGLELGFIWFPTDLPEVLDGVGVQASYTALDSIQDIPVQDEAGKIIGTDTTPMFGVSDSSYSWVLIYEKTDFDFRLSYVWRDDFLNNYEAALFANPLGVYRKPEESMDFQVNYNVTDDFMISFDATNLTDEVFQSYYEYPTTHNFGSAIYSRTFAVGARYSF